MRRQKKFYAWGYADEDLTQDEIRPWEAGIAKRYGLSASRRPPRLKRLRCVHHASWCHPRYNLSFAPIISPCLSTLTAWLGSTPAGCSCARCPIRPTRWPFPTTNKTACASSHGATRIRAKAIPYVGGSSVVKGIEPAAEFERVVTISMRHMD